MWKVFKCIKFNEEVVMNIFEKMRCWDTNFREGIVALKEMNPSVAACGIVIFCVITALFGMAALAGDMAFYTSLTFAIFALGILHDKKSGHRSTEQQKVLYAIAFAAVMLSFAAFAIYQLGIVTDKIDVIWKCFFIGSSGLFFIISAMYTGALVGTMPRRWRTLVREKYTRGACIMPDKSQILDSEN